MAFCSNHANSWRTSCEMDNEFRRMAPPICCPQINTKPPPPLSLFCPFSRASTAKERCSRQTLLKHAGRLLAHDTFPRRVTLKFTLLSPRLGGCFLKTRFTTWKNFKMQMEKPYDYAALMIRVSAGFVIFISLSLIFLVVGNLIYTSFTERVNLNSKRTR
ncbi:unnamed protein product [Caenorhabditis brenneri]